MAELRLWTAPTNSSNGIGYGPNGTDYIARLRRLWRKANVSKAAAIFLNCASTGTIWRGTNGSFEHSLSIWTAFVHSTGPSASKKATRDTWGKACGWWPVEGSGVRVRVGNWDAARSAQRRENSRHC